ncbi:MAG: 23S rRNA (adenine(2503)-C(2))-methyltransferase RlmN [Oscillospiraceae bacterium]|jgi:23S rRNA (adenine2503-C2)-methyltransferase|nr:23S rRNA (adenine(2503)-C(2))-methyltransferase RlmN [Oscillospiraceae bacterium]
MFDDKKIEILSLYPEEIEAEPSYRRIQIFSWLGKRSAKTFSEMTNLPAGLRAELAERFTIAVPEETERRISADGTEKILWTLHDGERIETALMKYKHGTSVCISTQAGCRQGCAFCASGSHGLSRNLTAGEMLAQALYCGAAVNHVVLMGTGEPLDNFDQTVRFLKLISHPEGRGLSLRNVSLSTCGDAEGIRKLAELKVPVTLSVSLHAPDNETRNRLMPVNRKIPVEELMGACLNYFQITGRRISYEYVIIDGINDSPAHARKLAALLRKQAAHVNLIPVNPVPGKPFKQPDKDTIAKFVRGLGSIPVTVRRTLGSDIGAACGQMRSTKT